MEPGRELDYLISERVMNHKDKDIFPYYSTELSAAFLVVDHLKEFLNGTALPLAAFELRFTWFALSKKWECMIWNNAIIKERAETLPHAICLAALKAIGQT